MNDREEEAWHRRHPVLSYSRYSIRNHVIDEDDSTQTFDAISKDDAVQTVSMLRRVDDLRLRELELVHGFDQSTLLQCFLFGFHRYDVDQDEEDEAVTSHGVAAYYRVQMLLRAATLNADDADAAAFITCTAIRKEYVVRIAGEAPDKYLGVPKETWARTQFMRFARFEGSRIRLTGTGAQVNEHAQLRFTPRFCIGDADDAPFEDLDAYCSPAMVHVLRVILSHFEKKDRIYHSKSDLPNRYCFDDHVETVARRVGASTNFVPADVRRDFYSDEKIKSIVCNCYASEFLETQPPSSPAVLCKAATWEDLGAILQEPLIQVMQGVLNYVQGYDRLVFEHLFPPRPAKIFKCSFHMSLQLDIVKQRLKSVGVQARRADVAAFYLRSRPRFETLLLGMAFYPSTCCESYADLLKGEFQRLQYDLDEECKKDPMSNSWFVDHPELLRAFGMACAAWQAHFSLGEKLFATAKRHMDAREHLDATIGAFQHAYLNVAEKEGGITAEEANVHRDSFRRVKFRKT